MAAWIFIPHNSEAQHHYNAWFRTTLSHPVSEKIRIDTEWQHRRQNGQDNKNLLDKNLMFTFRNWMHYQHNEDVKFSVSPFAYFSHYRVIQQQADETAHPGKEIRLSAALELQHEIFRKLYITDRNALEYRMFGGSQSDITRLRNRLGIRYDLMKQIRFSFYDELLFNITGTPAGHFFDHDRISMNLEYSISSEVKLDLGYMHINRLSGYIIKENNIIMNLTCKL